MPGIGHLELMPEPDEPSLLTTVDSDAPGYPAKPMGFPTRRLGRCDGPPAR